MTTQIKLLVEGLSSLNSELEGQNLCKLLSEEDSSGELLGELVRFIELLQLSSNERVLEDPLILFRLSYISLLLGKEPNITGMVDALYVNPGVLEGLNNLNKFVCKQLVCNVKGRLRRLSPRDSKFEGLLGVLSRLGGEIPRDVVVKMETNSSSIRKVDI